jgi:hypothetical protein
MFNLKPLKMKKVLTFSILLISLVLVNTSCQKDPVTPPATQTLAEKYPNWVNLTWVKTNGSTVAYPRFNINISGNVATLTQMKYAANGVDILTLTPTYAKLVLNITSNTTGSITFTSGLTSDSKDITFGYTVDEANSDVTLTVTQNGVEYIYLLHRIV